jgi:hypothetical protein
MANERQPLRLTQRDGEGAHGEESTQPGDGPPGVTPLARGVRPFAQRSQVFDR